MKCLVGSEMCIRDSFFTRYKDLEPNKEVTGSGWGDKAEAEKILEEAKARFK